MILKEFFGYAAPRARVSFEVEIMATGCRFVAHL